MVAVTYKEYFNQAPPFEEIDSIDAMESYVAPLQIREPEAASSTRICTLVVGTIPGKSHQLLNKKDQESSKTLHMVVTDNGDQICEEQDNINLADSEWVISVEEKLKKSRLDEEESSREMLCIYRVPHCLREGDEKAYVPQMVSLGPYHHGNSSLSQMDLHKWRALNHVLKRNKHKINLYLDAVKQLEKEARASYDGTITLNSNEFVEMMVLDGCFVIELLLGTVKGFRQLGYSPNDPIFSSRGPIHSIQRDMIKLENQLPLFVLDRLLGLQEGNPCQEGRVAKLTPQFFDALMPTDEPILTKLDGNESEYLESRDQAEESSDKGRLHCLDVFRRSLLRRSPERPLRSHRWSKIPTFIKSSNTVNFVERRQQLVHCVTELREAGIKFKKRKTDRFWEITFDNGTLEIPRILIHDVTKSLLLNLVAFEQCHPNCNNYITSYVVFMDNLINSQQDVAFLHYHGIIEHWLGNDAEVADLFNHLCQEVAFDCRNSYLSSLSEGVNKHFNHKYNVWFASLKHKYFSNPWAVISLTAAGVLLLLTFLQTFYAVYGYHHPIK